MRSGLFRDAVIGNRQSDVFGDIFLAQPFSFRAITFAIGAVFFFTLLLLSFLPYQSTKIVSGRLMQDGKIVHAELHVPLRSINELSVGQSVRLTYSDYPSYEFGYQAGRITGGGDLMFPSGNGPTYRVPVSIEQPFMFAYGRRLPLEPGMVVQAQIVGVKQSLLGWLLNRSIVKN